VDLAIACNTPNDQPFEKIFGWERSAKLKQAERVKRYFNGNKAPPEYQLWIDFLNGTEAPAIAAYRDKWWNGRHPSRWTGSSLEADAKVANGYFNEARFEEFYNLRHSEYCWDIHGSGLAGLRSTKVDLVPAKCSQVLWEIHRLAMLIGRFVLEDLGQYLVVEFDDFQNKVNREVERIMTSGME
jgi:hypothetical protein